MKKRLNLSLLIGMLVFLNFQELRAQAASSRIIGAPSLQSGGSQICARPSFNSFSVIASLSLGGPFDGGNQFILELSDENGSFDNPANIQELARANGPNNGTMTTQEILFENFAVPENSNSDNFRLRVRSSSPEVIGAISTDPLPVHFFNDDFQIILNDFEDVIFCNVSSFNKTLSVRIEDGSGNSVNPDNFEWEWLKDGAIIVGESQSKLDVTEQGTYFARVPLGACQFFFSAFGGAGRSNNIGVSITDVASVVIETPAPDFSFCPNEVKILNSSLVDTRFKYQWIKNGEPIEGAVTSSITLPDNDFGGEYTLRIAISEDCSNLETPPVTIINEGSSITEPLPENLILLPSQTFTLQITTDAPEGSNVKWFVETALQSQGPLVGTTSSFDAQFVGKYRVEIEATDTCNSILFSETELFAPTGFEIKIGTKDENVCDAETFTLELLELLGETVAGLKIPLTQEQFAFFDFEWFKDGVSTGETTTSINVDRSDENAAYVLRADLRTGEFTNISSDPLIIALSGGITIQADPPVLTEGGTITLSVPQNDAHTYQWFRKVDGEDVLLEGQTNNTLEINENGEYSVKITTQICSLTISINVGGGGISEIIPNIVTPNSDGINDNWLLPASLFNQQDVEVTIYTSRGQVDFTSASYQNNWPLENSKSLGKDPIYYYIITKNNSVVRKGSITVMR
ncbi:CHU domain-containing protein [Aquimarina sp. MAR_2010_214]|uniref:T9SS type B sorting domain-containing protein n=1 Tax=Aquimarina sp. MAR_2010_214 TaxID=1250026 RepID=UPI000C6FE6A4|nr:gliding motility-associated C-terminal domain-containing protein [Aquimarina sp. MAR_2010_214]PKV48746.1 CHU domain-containing protein [Aquimarina sp. MAR_2010_214]